MPANVGPQVYMMTHHFPFFLSSTLPSTLPSMGVTGGASTAGDGATESVGLFANSPVAFSNEVRPSSASFVVLENQPPGKKRDDVVDSRRARVLEGETSAGAACSSAAVSICSFSSTTARRPRLGLTEHGHQHLLNTRVQIGLL